MPSTASLIDDLWNEGVAILTTSFGEKYKILFSRPADFFDIVIADSFEPIGFITLKNEGAGTYSIVNDTKVNPHPSFINTPGHGIEVKNKFRKKGVGAALLSIGIGIVQKDWRLNNRGGDFKVVASDITGQGLGCYQNFGFVIMEGMRVSSGYYNDSRTVPEINILAGRASFFKRLKTRLRI
jgi:ribosomal protein S18 acetylase RimI-like enzyme